MKTSSKHEAKPLGERIQKARSEGRTQQALELAKQLAKQEPTPEHHELLRAVVFERGVGLLKDGKPREAIVVFQNALNFNAPPEYRAAVAAKLAEAGDVGAAMRLFGELPDSPERTKAFIASIDTAVVNGTVGRALLPVDLHPAFDAVINAFGLVETNQDEAAREALQPIGLSSPFLEWKMMLRGLIAYYQNDDARAMDNWQRLDPQRGPWRLIAPFRFQIDPSFRDAQPVPTRQRLQTILNRLGDVGGVGALRTLEKALHSWEDEREVKNSFRQARDLMSSIGKANPLVAERLGRVFYAKIARDGTTDDISRYAAIFAAPADDPKLTRLKALVGEECKLIDVTVESWLAFQNDVSAMSDRFPEPSGSLARALILEHVAGLLNILDGLVKPPDGVPRAEACYRRSIELVPGRLEPHAALFEMLKDAPAKRTQALAAAKTLVAEFPNHAAGWEYIGDAIGKGKKFADVAAAYRNALKADPMNRDVRRKLADAVWAQGLKLATPTARAKTGPDIEAYRPFFEETIRLTDGSPLARIAAWAIVEFRLGHDDFARELLAKGENLPHSRVAMPLALYAATVVDKKFPDAARAEHELRWHQALEQKPTPAEILAALDALVPFDSKALQGKNEVVGALLPKLTEKKLEAFSEDQLLKLGQVLSDLKMKPLARKVVEHGEKRFRKNPAFVLMLADLSMKGPGGKPRGDWRTRQLLEKARHLALALPREQQERILKEIELRESRIGEPEIPAALRSMFGRLMDGFGFDDDDEDDFDEEW